jgi:hypothetical protein
MFSLVLERGNHLNEKKTENVVFWGIYIKEIYKPMYIFIIVIILETF